LAVRQRGKGSDAAALAGPRPAGLAKGRSLHVGLWERVAEGLGPNRGGGRPGHRSWLGCPGQKER